MKIKTTMIKKVVLTAAALLVAGAGAAQQTRVLTPDRYSDYGLVYSLPSTALRITVKALHTVKKAGPFYRYAKKQIGTDNVIMEDSETWEVTDITVTPYGVASDSLQYKMQLKAGVPTYLCVADDGMLLAVNKRVEAPSLPPMAQPSASEMEVPTGNEYLQYVSEDFLSSQSSAKQAQMLAESIMEVRDARLSLTRGTADTMPTDGRQLELMLNSLGDQEKRMMEAFCGTTTQETAERSFTMIPDDEGSYIIARLSNYGGFVEPDDLSGSPIVVEVSDIEEPDIPLDEKGNPRVMPKEGVAYRLPSTASVRVTWNDKPFFGQDIEMGQFGVTFGLDPSIFTNKKNPSYAVFNPVTGALVEVGLQRDTE